MEVRNGVMSGGGQWAIGDDEDGRWGGLGMEGGGVGEGDLKRRLRYVVGFVSYGREWALFLRLQSCAPTAK
jgi:hypothetical protein